MTLISYFRVLQTLVLLLTFITFFFFLMLFGKRHVQLVLGGQELCDVLASNERLLEVKEADFYFMNLAALLQVYALGIDLAVR